MDSIPQYSAYEQTLTSSRTSANPYTEQAATAVISRPDGGSWSIPLFWDGGSAWRLRFAPDLPGTWSWTVESADEGLDGETGTFVVGDPVGPGGLVAMPGHPLHFGRQDGTPFYFIGDTAWALFTDDAEEEHDREAAFAMIERRVEQGYNVLHAMCISEAGWGNRGGDAFDDLEAETVNPGYWQEVDERIRFANDRGVTVGLVLAWADKGRNPHSWRAFPSQDARLRYARYMAARYSAYDVYFITAGEWNADTRRDLSLSDEEIADQYREIGRAVRGSDPHGRLIGIHPTGTGTVREFAGDDWCDFGDYQQLYHDMHEGVLISRETGKPVVNAEYAYFLRDQDEDGVCDKQNSATIDEIRAATWDILMAGGYIVTGYGSTYFGGHRHPGPFNLADPENAVFEEQIQVAIRFFKARAWWKLEPADDRIAAGTARVGDEVRTFTTNGRERTQPSPPSLAYWALKGPDTLIGYVRNLSETLTLDLRGLSVAKAGLYDVRTGEWEELDEPGGAEYRFTPPDASDWVIVVE